MQFKQLWKLILNEKVFQQLGTSLHPVHAKLRAYTREYTDILGKVDISMHVEFDEQKKQLSAYIVKGARPCLLGSD